MKDTKRRLFQPAAKADAERAEGGSGKEKISDFSNFPALLGQNPSKQRKEKRGGGEIFPSLPSGDPPSALQSETASEVQKKRNMRLHLSVCEAQVSPRFARGTESHFGQMGRKSHYLPSGARSLIVSRAHLRSLYSTRARNKSRTHIIGAQDYKPQKWPKVSADGERAKSLGLWRWARSLTMAERGKSLIVAERWQSLGRCARGESLPRTQSAHPRQSRGWAVTSLMHVYKPLVGLSHARQFGVDGHKPRGFLKGGAHYITPFLCSHK